MKRPGHFSSITQRGPLGHVVTMRAPGVEVEVHARTRQEAEEDAFLALTREVRRREAFSRCRSVFRSFAARRHS